MTATNQEEQSHRPLAGNPIKIGVEPCPKSLLERGFEPATLVALVVVKLPLDQLFGISYISSIKGIKVKVQHLPRKSGN